MSQTLAIVLMLGFLSCGGGQAPLPMLGRVKLESLCSDVARCDVRGDVATNLLKGAKAAPIYLAEGQGPTSYLGKVAPARKAQGVLKTCSGDIARSDWFESGPSVHTVDLSSDGKLQLRSALKAHLARGLLAHSEALPETATSIDATVEGSTSALGLQKIGMSSQTYWLKDAAFERRVGQCGEEEYANIIYSLTLLELSDLTRKELEAKLVMGLETQLDAARAKPASPLEQMGDGGNAGPLQDAQTAPESAAPDGATRHALLREIAFAAVGALANDLRMIAALGFDEN